MRFTHWINKGLCLTSGLLSKRHGKSGRRTAARRGAFRPCLEGLEDRCVPAIFTVNTPLDTVDSNEGDGLAADANGLASLRAAIMEANANLGDDTIILPAGTYNLTIDVSGDHGGDLDIRDSLILTGAGAATTIIDAGGFDNGGLHRVLDIHGAIPVGISGVTIRNGNPGDDFNGGGGVRVASDGDDAAYTVTFTDCIITGNTAVNGGGINNDDTENNSLVLVRTTVSNNTATVNDGSGGGGGGILHAPNSAGSLTLIDSTVSGNTAGTEGGGILTADGSVAVTNSTISGNTAGGHGGGIANFGSLCTLTNVTITNNVADSDDNESGDGGGIFDSDGTISLLNTIVAGNTDGGGEAPDCLGTITSQGHNLIQSTAGFTITGDTTGNILGQDPLLGPLADNGGPTLTHVPQAGSPAIDAGTSTGAPATDQRGFTRPAGAGVDIGAVEVGGLPPPPPTPRHKKRLTFTLLSKSTAFHNELGVFVVDDAAGRIGQLGPADPGYAAAALARRHVIFTGADGAGSVRRLKLPAGALFGFYLVQNGSSADAIAANPGNRLSGAPRVFFSFPAANPDGFAHARRLTARQFAFEDLTGGGDRDFNDLVVRFGGGRRPQRGR
jgi:hypothetical protein